MAQSNLFYQLVIVFVLLTIPFELGRGCIFQPKKGPKTPDQARLPNFTGIFRKLAKVPCICGEEPVHPKVTQVDHYGDIALDDPWIFYIHVTLDDYGDELSQRLCVGTLVNSNMILTSHRCLQKTNELLLPDVWRGGGPSLATKEDIIVTRTEFLDREVSDTYNVRQIIYRERFFLDWRRGKVAPESDVVIIVLDEELTANVTHGGKVVEKVENETVRQETSKVYPICLPFPNQLPTSRLLNLEAYYQGVREVMGSEYKYIVGIRNFSHIQTAEECNEEGNLRRRPSSNETLCIRFVTAGPNMEGGPLRIVVGRWAEPGPQRGYLVGIANWVQKGIKHANHKHAFFTNVNSFVKYVEHQAELHDSNWCSTPDPVPAHWPWEGYEEEMDTSLDCECGRQPSSGAQGRIVGGEEATPGEYPWLVKLFFHGGNSTTTERVPNGTVNPGCVGSVINDRLILSAAHCFALRDEIHGNTNWNTSWLEWPDYIYIHGHNATPGPEDLFINASDIERIHYHPGYLEETAYFGADLDIAVIVLKERLKLGEGTPRLEPICLPQPGYVQAAVENNQTDAVVAGWGSEIPLLFARITAGAPLKKIVMPIRPLFSCMQIDWLHERERHQAPTDTRLCAGVLDARSDFGRGDTGGPLMHEDKEGRVVQVGIASHDNEYFDKGTWQSTSFFTNVEAFLPYINYYSNLYNAKGCRKSGRAGAN